jgi:CRISPR-associated protein Csy3
MVELNSSTQTVKHLPSVLAFRRGIIVSDAPLEYQDKDGIRKPVMVMLHGVMGTQNVNEKEVDNVSSTVVKGERDVRNLQTIETAKMGPGAQRMIATFDLKSLCLIDAMHSCSSTKNQEQANIMRDSLTGFIQRAMQSEGINQVARRLARNICNGRWLWRNRLMASSIEITVSSTEKTWVIPNALELSLQHFDNFSKDEIEIGAVIANGMKGNDPRAHLRVEAQVDFGAQGAIEVYGSQNYEPKAKDRSKDSSAPSRSLYKLTHPDMNPTLHIMGQAALRDAKIWNALRTIDTWYADYAIHGMPIPVEPQGASLEMMQFFRAKKTSAFDLFKQLNVIDPASREGMYCIASLMRGGVFSEGEDKDTKTPAKTKVPEESTEAIGD